MSNSAPTKPTREAEDNAQSELTMDQLTSIFRNSEKPQSQWRVGLEAEKFVVHRPSGRPIDYAGPDGIEGIFRYLVEQFDWQPKSELEGGPTLSLLREQSSITLEPAAQFELSGAPAASLQEVDSEWQQHLRELKALQDEFDLAFLHLGFHPWAKHEDLPWVPKLRYPIMKSYLPKQGTRGLDMMRRTATVQANLDYGSEQDAFDKLRTLLRLTPLLQAMLVNAPFIEGERSPLLSERLDVWLNMDPQRSGLIQQLWTPEPVRYEDYVQWALDAGMFLFVRDGRVIANTGQSFRSFMQSGFDGHRATLADWKVHLGSLFPEVRMKNTLEVRCIDGVPPHLTMAVPSLLMGLTYDEESLSAARELAGRVQAEHAVELQRSVSMRGLQAQLDGHPLQHWCSRLLEIARAGLARLEEPTRYLDPLQQLVDAGQTPAQAMLDEWKASGQSLQAYCLGTSRL